MLDDIDVDLLSAWLSDTKVVAGTDTGLICLVHGSEQQRGNKNSVFGQVDEDGNNAPIVNMLTRNDIVVAISAVNCVALFEVRRVAAVTGGSVQYQLMGLARIKISNLCNILGIQW